MRERLFATWLVSPRGLVACLVVRSSCSSWYSPWYSPTSYIYTHPCLSWVGMKCWYESILIEKSSIYLSALPLAKVPERSVPRGVLTLLRVLPHFHVRRGIGGHCPARVTDVQLRTWFVWASTRYMTAQHRPPGRCNWNPREKKFLCDSQLSSSPYGLSTSYWSSVSSSGI